ncbi:cytoplasmic protein [Ectobacillus sp. JY-23]|uniref:cytoplasmic protein n=1 Tax=Ectobacillus sp. JY-23 TaxID=2933872 RepID=UPI001FF57744|nr:cytoplasmic protein [Ectobacillus sp. JY-23]UOY93381.1 cytoplasmic protein [Ectobacillus sp. JY-23]
MNQEQYRIINMQMKHEEHQVMKEIGLLLQELQNVTTQKERELYRLTSRSRMLQTGADVAGGILSLHTFAPDRLKEYDKRILKIREFIQKNETILQQIREKQKVVQGLFVEQVREHEREMTKKEERHLLDFKMCLAVAK